MALFYISSFSWRKKHVTNSGFRDLLNKYIVPTAKVSSIVIYAPIQSQSNNEKFHAKYSQYEENQLQQKQTDSQGFTQTCDTSLADVKYRKDATHLSTLECSTQTLVSIYIFNGYCDILQWLVSFQHFFLQFSILEYLLKAAKHTFIHTHTYTHTQWEIFSHLNRTQNGFIWLEMKETLHSERVWVRTKI